MRFKARSKFFNLLWNDYCNYFLFEGILRERIFERKILLAETYCYD